MADSIESHGGYYDPGKCDVAQFQTLIRQTTDAASVPHAAQVQHNIPLYDVSDLALDLEDPARKRAIMAEWAQVLRAGAGALVLKRCYDDAGVLDAATAIYMRIIEAEKAKGRAGSDHFAASGANDRIWNSLQKLCEAAPDIFLRYFANTAIATACEAWLGPHYQMTAQVNLVHPGGAAQKAHRDYHLGFQSAEVSASYPAHVHDISPILTLQGAIAHCDMPLESGPTKLLPFSQAYRPGYTAWRRDDFRAVFEAQHVQLPLDKGDALFFNPALFHAAGANTSADIRRFANLLQVSSAFGRAMETVDRDAMCKLIYPHAVQAKRDLPAAALSAAIAATAEGYSFPTNLDLDPPQSGLAPETQAGYFHRALAEGLAPDAFAEGLDKLAKRRRA